MLGAKGTVDAGQSGGHKQWGWRGGLGEGWVGGGGSDHIRPHAHMADGNGQGSVAHIRHGRHLQPSVLSRLGSPAGTAHPPTGPKRDLDRHQHLLEGGWF